MKQKMNFARMTRTALLLSLIVCAVGAAARAQVIPRGCVAGFTTQIGTVNLAANIPAGFASQLMVDKIVPVDSLITINPGGVNQQGGSQMSSYRITAVSGDAAPYALIFGGDTMLAHQAGEPVQFESKEYQMSWGYENLSSNSVNIPTGFPDNYFTPGTVRFPNQPSTFLPGINENVFSTRFVMERSMLVSRVLNGRRFTFDFNKPVRCATMTYQGRLSDGNTAANGQYDLRFTVFDALTDGAAQSSSVRVEDAQVTNGIFTVQLNFGSALANNFKANFMEIAVRPGAAGGSDPFTVLPPRQPITKVPNSVNADTATNATNVSGGIVQLPLTTDAPPNTTAGGCNNVAQYGSMRVDATNNRLYVCTSSGWKSTVLQ